MMLSRKQIRLIKAQQKEKRFLKKFFKVHSPKNQNCSNCTNGKNCEVCGRRIGKGERDQQGIIVGADLRPGQNPRGGDFR